MQDNGQPGPSQLPAANAHEDVGQSPIYWPLKEQALISAACPGAWSHNHPLRFHNCVERETWKMHSDQGLGSTWDLLNLVSNILLKSHFQI